MREIMQIIADTFLKGVASVIVFMQDGDKVMNKGRGANRNPFYGRVKIVKTLTGMAVGTDYTNSLVNTAKRMGEDVKREDVNLAKVWHKPCAFLGEWFSTDRKTESKIYLKLQRNEQQVAFTTTTEYYLDDELVTDTETLNKIKAWIPEKSKNQSSTQTALGIDKEHECQYILVELKNVLLIKQNERVFKPHEVLAMAYAV